MYMCVFCVTEPCCIINDHVSLILFSPQQGHTVTDLAREHGNEEIIKLLKNPQKVKEVSLFY